MSIEVRSVSRRFGAFAAVDHVDLRVESGELVALLGPSGSGKTTLLRIIAGLEPADAGSIHFDGEDATDDSVRERRVGFVFQHYALFRHLTVFENIAFGLRVRPRRSRPNEQEIRTRVQRLLTLVQLDSLAARYPSQLSGGQRQRVALARALAVEPRVLLLDEPFGALDAKVRKELRRWLRRLHDELHVTSLFVTHDQDEALELADRVVIMNQGKIEQVGSPEDVYTRPASPFVLDFLGDVNVWHCRIEDGRVVVGGVPIDVPAGRAPAQGSGKLYVRPHAVAIEPASSGAKGFPATIAHVNRAGPIVRVELRTAWGDAARVELSPDAFDRLHLSTGAEVVLVATDRDVFVVSDDGAVHGRGGASLAAAPPATIEPGGAAGATSSASPSAPAPVSAR
jgi:sulfate transport system ATP-binding protein